MSAPIHTMNFAPNETQAAVQKLARDFATRVVLPAAAAIDREARFPTEILRELGKLGLMAVNVPEPFGGAGAGVVAYALAMQEIARACASTAVTMAVTNMVGEVICAFGSDAQKKRYCPRLASGELLCACFALSEPEAGSDPGAMRTTAVRDGGDWVIQGAKQWITSGAHAGVYVVWARTAGASEKSISCFLVDRGTPGLHVGREEDKMGLRGSNTVGLEFDQCRVPGDALLGPLHGGFRIAMTALDGGRIGVASQAIGIARAALDESVTYAKERTQFGAPIASFQAIQWKLANMKTELDAAHMLTMRAAWLKEAKRPFSREASMAKLFASEAANRICNHAVQIHGGYGYTREFAAERHLRDVRVTTIYEGTSEIQRLVIARSLLGS